MPTFDTIYDPNFILIHILAIKLPKEFISLCHNNPNPQHVSLIILHFYNPKIAPAR